MKAKWFCCAFKLAFLPLICKASLFFKSNLELALSITLKQRELYESKHVVAECRCLKIWDLLSFLISLIKCLIDRLFEISNNRNSFHNYIENIKSSLIKSAYPPFVINKVIKKYFDYKFSSNQNQLKDKSDVHYFILPYIFHTISTCFDSYNSLSFKIIDKTNYKFDLNIKESLHINWRKPKLNA